MPHEMKPDKNKELPKAPPPVFTKLEALSVAAQELRSQASLLELAATVMDAVNAIKDKSQETPEVRHFKKEMIEPELQARAKNAAAEEIERWVMEERLVEARAQARGLGV